MTHNRLCSYAINQIWICKMALYHDRRPTLIDTTEPINEIRCST